MSGFDLLGLALSGSGIIVGIVFLVVGVVLTIFVPESLLVTLPAFLVIGAIVFPSALFLGFGSFFSILTQTFGTNLQNIILLIGVILFALLMLKLVFGGLFGGGTKLPAIPK